MKIVSFFMDGIPDFPSLGWLYRSRIETGSDDSFCFRTTDQKSLVAGT